MLPGTAESIAHSAWCLGKPCALTAFGYALLQVRGQLSKLERKTLSALIVVDVHARDVATELANQVTLQEFLQCSQKVMREQLERGFVYQDGRAGVGVEPCC